MEIANSLECYSDKDFNNLLLGKHVEIDTINNEYIDVVTGFINAVQWDDPERKIVGVILDRESEILFSKEIKKITIE